MKVRIGRVCGNRKLVIHLSIAGRTCASNRPVNIETTTTRATGARLCKLCFTRTRIEAAQQRSQSSRFDQRSDTILGWAREQILTPEERTASEAFAAQLREALSPTTPARESSAWGAIRARNTATHKQPIAA